MTKDRLSVNIIVPIYNVEALLPRCVDSLLAQTHQDIRVVLVDDGSTDCCPRICDRYAEKDCRVSVVHKENGGISSARNAGLDWVFAHLDAAGYIGFVDPDDWVDPDYIEFLLSLLANSDARIVQCGHWISYSTSHEEMKNSDTSKHILNKHEAMESLCRNGLWDVTLWNKLYLSEVFEDIRFPVGRLYEDTATAHLISDKSDCEIVDMTPKYHYTQRYTSIANGMAWKESKHDLVLAGDQLADWVEARYPDLRRAAMEKRVFVRLSTLSQMVNCGHYDEKRIREYRKFITQCAGLVLCDRRASKRDKLGILALLPGFWCYRAIWSRYYEAKRNRTVADPTGTPDTTGKEQS